MPLRGKSRRRDGEIFASREGAKARRRRFYPQIPQIDADYGVVPCRCAASRAAGMGNFLPHAKARRREEDVFIHRFRRLSQIMASCLAAARQVAPPGWGNFCLTRRREGAKKTFLSTDSADCRRLWRRVLPLRGKSRRREEGAKARRRRFYPQIPQIVADYGVVSCRCAASRAAGMGKFLPHAKARRREEDVFIHRFRRLSQIMASCLAAARQVATPGWGNFCLTRRREGAKKTFLSADSADCRRLWRRVLPLRGKTRRREEGAKKTSS
ncbi:hypothetical protein [Oligosphaera ethanolica]|uniref:Nucleoid DNA-binding protein n=1 Tax=Oligosphaera ethanolica TaxID=760260 RepID=A0AAE3VGL8_9BACT|nr:hypothetical protein [Oligosphaera ethanolica]MDQ0290041.1 nucleoid DNA-binding protein [Oligosphaera ethanolica]